MSQGTWHRIAAQLGWPVDASVAALRDAPPDTQRISLELARTYQKLLRPFEEVWTKSLLKQQQTLLENHRNGQQQQQFGGGTGAAASGPSAQTPLQPAAPPPPLRPPSQNAQIGNNHGGATSLEASRQQLLQQAKAASLATQQLQASPAGQAKAQLSAVTSTTTPGTTTSSSSKLNVDPTMEQMAEAKNMVSHIRQQIEASRREWLACLPARKVARFTRTRTGQTDAKRCCPHSSTQSARDSARSAGRCCADYARLDPGSPAGRRDTSALPRRDGRPRGGSENVDLCECSHVKIRLETYLRAHLGLACAGRHLPRPALVHEDAAVCARHVGSHSAPRSVPAVLAIRQVARGSFTSTIGVWASAGW